MDDQRPIADTAPLPTRATRWEERKVVDEVDSPSGIHRIIQGKRLELQELIAKGGMGAIFAADDQVLDRSVALKYLGEEDAEDHGEMLRRFVREARITAQLEHPNIVPLYDIGVDGNGRAYFVMRRIEGLSLRQLLKARRRGTDDGNWTTERLLQAMVQVCHATAFAHQRGILHRDIKPDNIMLGRFGEVYLMDWGLAVRTACQGEERPGEQRGDLAHLDGTLYGRIWGSIPFMAPEQARGEDLDDRADVYALGVSLYVLLTGRLPVEAEDIDAYLDFLDVTPHLCPAAADAAVQIPADLDAIVRRATEQDLERRYPSAAELAADLERYLDGRPVRARPATAWTHVAAFLRRHRHAATAMAAMLVMGLGVLSVVGWRAWASMREAASERAAREQVERQHEWQWREVLGDDFERSELGLAWILEGSGGRAWLEDGQLHLADGEPHHLRHAEPFHGDLRLSFRAKIVSDYLNDISCELGRARFQLGGFDNTRILLSFGNEQVWTRTASPLERDRWYAVTAERIGRRYRLVVDGAVVIDHELEHAGAELGGAIALYGWQAHNVYDDLRLWRLDQPETWSALDLAERAAARGEHAAADALARMAAEGSNDPAVVERARRLAEQQGQQAELEGAALRLRERIAQRWPEAMVRIEPSNRGLLVLAQSCGIDDCAVFAGMPIDRLSLDHNPITDLSPLRGLELDMLAISGCPVVDLSPLSGSGLRKLYAEGTEVRSIAGLSFPQLEAIHLSDSRLTTIDGFDAPALKEFKIRRCATVADLSPLRGMAALEQVMVDGTAVSDLTPISGCQLTGLSVADTAVADLSPVAGDPLVFVDISRTAIGDLSAVANPKLVRLLLDGSAVSDLSPLRPCAQLTKLQAEDLPGVVDLSPVAELPLRELLLGATRATAPARWPDWPLETFTTADIELLGVALAGAGRIPTVGWRGPVDRKLAALVDGRVGDFRCDLAEAEVLPQGVERINGCRRADVVALWPTLRAALVSGAQVDLRGHAGPGPSGPALLVPQRMTQGDADRLAAASGARIAVISGAGSARLQPMMRFLRQHLEIGRHWPPILVEVRPPGLEPYRGWSGWSRSIYPGDDRPGYPVLCWPESDGADE